MYHFLNSAMKVFDDSNPPLVDIADHSDQRLREHLSSLSNSDDASTFATAEGVLHHVRSLERRQHAQSRFRRMAGYLQPLIDFLMMYTPALDIMVQFDPNPSAIVWGSLKALLQASTPTLEASKQHAHASGSGPHERRTILQIHRMRIGKARRHPLNFGEIRKDV